MHAFCGSLLPAIDVSKIDRTLKCQRCFDNGFTGESSSKHSCRGFAVGKRRQVVALCYAVFLLIVLIIHPLNERDSQVVVLPGKQPLIIRKKAPGRLV